MAALTYKRILQSTTPTTLGFGVKEVVVDLETVHGSAVNRSKAILLIDVAANSSNRNRVHVRAEISEDGTELTLSRGGPLNDVGDFITNVSYKIIEFSAGLTTHWITGNAYEKLNVAQSHGLTLDMSRTFGILNYKIDMTGGMSETNIIALNLESEQYTLDCSSSLNADDFTDFVIQIVEFDADSGVSVQHVSGLTTGGSLTEYALSTAVPINRTMLMGTVCRGTSSGGVSNRSGKVTIKEDGSALILEKANSTVTNTQFYGSAITFPEWVTVYHNIHSLNGLTQTLNHPEVDWNDALTFTQGGVPVFGQNGTSTIAYKMVTTVPGEIGSQTFVERLVTGGLNFTDSLNIQLIVFGDAADPTPTWPDDLMEGLSQMDEKQWRCPVLTPGKTSNWLETVTGWYYNEDNNSVGAVYYAWPCTILDTKRDVMVGHGGGHANYSGNEIYECDLHTGLFNRVCLTSDVTRWQDGAGAYLGSPLYDENDAPASAHCYSTSVYLPISDVYVIHGGAAQGDGGRYKSFIEYGVLGEEAGPYVYDATKRDPFKVGGATGTGRDPSYEGLNAWHNAWDPSLTVTYKGVNASAFVDVEDGKDVVYLYGGGNVNLYKTVINDPYDWSKNPQTLVGGDLGHSTLSKAAYVKSLGCVVNIKAGATTSLDTLLRAVDLNGAVNGRTLPYVITPTDPDNILGDIAHDLQLYSLVWDEARDRIVGYCKGQLIEIRHQSIMPDGATDGDFVNQWSIHLVEANFDADYRQLDSRSSGSGADPAPYGRWWYYRKYDVFIYTESYHPTNNTAKQPYLWYYKPENWQPLVSGAVGTVDSIQTTPSLPAVTAYVPQNYIGLNFRKTAGEIDDGIGNTHADDSPYPVTFQNWTYGWTGDGTLVAHDFDYADDPRTKGRVEVVPGSGNPVLRIDVPSPGVYELDILYYCIASSPEDDAWEIRDGSIVRWLLPSTEGSFADATGTPKFDADAWIASRDTIQINVTGTVINFYNLGNGIAYNDAPAEGFTHIRVERVSDLSDPTASVDTIQTVPSLPTLTAIPAAVATVASIQTVPSLPALTATTTVIAAATSTVHSHFADEVGIITNTLLDISNSLHGHISTEVQISVGYDILVADAVHAHTADQSGILQNHVVLPTNSTHDHVADAVNTTQNYIIGINSAEHAHTADTINTIQNYNISINSTAHGHTASAPEIFQNHVIAVSSALHNHSVDVVQIAITGNISANEAFHAHYADQVGILQNHIISPSSAVHAHSADKVASSVSSTTQPEDALHSITSSQVNILQNHIISIAETNHFHYADEVTITIAGTITIASTIHVHVADQVTTRQNHVIAPSSTVHGLTSDEVEVLFGLVVAADSTVHGHYSDTAQISQYHQITINSSLHQLLSDVVAITTAEPIPPRKRRATFKGHSRTILFR